MEKRRGALISTEIQTFPLVLAFYLFRSYRIEAKTAGGQPTLYYMTTTMYSSQPLLLQSLSLSPYLSPAGFPNPCLFIPMTDPFLLVVSQLAVGEM